VLVPYADMSDKCLADLLNRIFPEQDQQIEREMKRLQERRYALLYQYVQVKVEIERRQRNANKETVTE